MQKKFNKNSLFGEWIHSHEEDTANEIVFRPSNYAFPLTRSARNIYHFAPDGMLIKGEPTASDSINKIEDKWDLKSDEISMYEDGKLINKKVIASIDKNKLVLKKP